LIYKVKSSNKFSNRKKKLKQHNNLKKSTLKTEKIMIEKTKKTKGETDTFSSQMERYYLEISNLFKICKEISDFGDPTNSKVERSQISKNIPSKLDGEDFILTEFSLGSGQYIGLYEIFSNLIRVLTEGPLEIEHLHAKIEFIRNSFNNIDSRLQEIRKICYIRRGIINLLRNCIKTSRSQIIENAAKDSIMKVNSIIIDLLKNRFLTVELEELD